MRWKNGEKSSESNSLHSDEEQCMIGNQNSTENLRLLAAQQQLYIEAKYIGKLRFLGSLALAIAGTWLIANYSEARIGVQLCSALLTIIVIISKQIQKDKIVNAAKIQEEFDTGLFGLPWNHILVGSKVSKESMLDAFRRFKGDKDKLIDWYPEVSQAQSPMDILLCQRTNLNWDWRLRKKYVWVLGLITALVAILEISFCWYNPVSDFVIQFFLPSLPLLIMVYENIKGNYEIAGQKEAKEKVITSLYC